jgi:hypothetical protein
VSQRSNKQSKVFLQRNWRSSLPILQIAMPKLGNCRSMQIFQKMADYDQSWMRCALICGQGDFKSAAGFALANEGKERVRK